MSWVQLPYNVWIGRVRTFLHDTVEPYLGLFRRLIPPIGAFDLSPIVALIVLQLVYEIMTHATSAFETVWRDRADLEDRVHELETSLGELRDTEHAMRDALVTAQR